ncbi:MAG: lipopolysaccharide biosynthesis protein, partial [Planctomycetota bacterium]
TVLHTTEGHDRIRNAYLRTNRYALWLGLAGVIPLMTFADEIVRLYLGPKFAMAGPVITLVLLGPIIMFANVLLSNLANATAKVGRLAWRGALLNVTGLVLAFVMLKYFHMGVIGAALGFALTAVIGQPLLYWPLGRKLADVSFQTWLSKSFVPGFAPAAAGGIVWVALKYAWPVTGWGQLVAYLIAGMTAYLVVLFVFCLADYERKELRQMWRKITGAPAPQPEETA